MKHFYQVSPSRDSGNWRPKPESANNDIKNFVSEKQWPLLVKCLLMDDESALRRFSLRLGDDWSSFLLSWDTTRKLRECKSENRRTKYGGIAVPKEHPYPTNVFLMAIMFNARRCCQLIKQLTPNLDLAEITEYDFNGYHVLFLGLHVLWLDESPEHFNEQMEYIRFFLIEIFTSDQVDRMSHSINCLGMRPLDWAIFRGHVHVVEKLMYLSHTLDSKSKVAGVMEHAELDLSFSVSTSLNRSLTVLSVMNDLYGETNLANLKSLGIFRKPLLIAPWIDALFWRSSWLLAVYFVERLLHCCLTLIFFDYKVGDYIIDRCNGNYVHRLPNSFLGIFGYSLFASSWQAIVSVMGERRKYTYRRSKNYPSFYRAGMKDALRWQVPYLTSAIMATVILILATNPQWACQFIGADHLRSLIGCLMLGYVMASILSVLVLSRLITFMSKFINSFYRSFSMFANFLLCYIMLLCIFARLFQASGRFVWPNDAQVSNCSSGTQSELKRLSFTESFYQSFLLTLNVVNTATFSPLPDRVDLLVTHFVFILMVPTLFINFVTGLLSSVVSDTMDHDVEALYLLKLNFAEYAETTYFWLYRSLNWLRGRRESQLIISLCIPLHLSSKSISDIKETL